jgi:hypothetical protein
MSCFLYLLSKALLPFELILFYFQNMKDNCFVLPDTCISPNVLKEVKTVNYH